MIVQEARRQGRPPLRLLALLLAALLGACAPAPRPPADTAASTDPSAARAASPTPSTPAQAGRPTPTTRATPSPSPAPTLAPTATLAPVASDQRAEIFNLAWELVAERYIYEDYRGVDWAALREELLPQVLAAEQPEEFYGLLREMVERLGDEHSRFESPQEVAAEQQRYSGTLTYGGIGAMVRTVAEGGLITSLAPRGPAARAGLRPRDVILRVGNLAFNDPDAFGPGGPVTAIQGPPGSTLRLTVRSPGAKPRTVTLTRAIIPGDAFAQVDLRLLPGTRVALLRIDTFYVEDVDKTVRQKLEQLAADEPIEGLIVDVRANSGGRVDMMLETVGLFSNGGVIGSSQGRRSSALLAAPANAAIPQLEDVPMAVLVGPDTVSAAEMFAAGLQALGRATLVGMPSAGNTESIRPHSFADGSRLWLAELAFQLPDGSTIEGTGVQPDRPIDVAWWRFEPQDDPQVRAALRALGL
jgi:carboxyl-terminal processing protease